MIDIEEFVRMVESRMRTVIARTPAAAPAHRLLDAGGKRLRARLLWWAAHASATTSSGAPAELLVCAAAAIELAHLGSLVHDDIVDESETRRGVAAVHREHGVAIAAEAGAALAHLASELVATLGSRARGAMRRALLATCRGQIRELALPFVVVTPQERLTVMQEKTGAFFELAAALGAIVAGSDVRAAAAVRRFARRFGVAFQIADDVLDLVGDPKELGRANGADLRDGVLTLPYLLTEDPQGTMPPLLKRIRAARDARAIAECASVILRRGGVAAAAAVAASWLARAIAALEVLPARDARGQLRELARASVARGLRIGRPKFVADTTEERCSASLFAAPFLESPDAHEPANAARVPARIERVLEWFHPGLSAMAAARANEHRIAVRRNFGRETLSAAHGWSADAGAAAEAVALAHALADEAALCADPVRTMATVDALHCAAIGVLATLPSAHEHERLAIRAQALFLRTAPTAPTSPFVPMHTRRETVATLSA